MRLIPKRPELGWMPYSHLVYLAIFWLGPIVGEGTPRDYALTALGTAIFLPLYFLGYWLPRRKALISSGLIALLGILYAPINWGASVFFVYAAAPLGYTGSAGFAFRLVLVVAALPPLQAWLMGLPPFFWVPASVFSLIVGGSNIHYAGVMRAQAALRRSQEEVERLAKLAERERIARDLHDLLGHTLTVITRKAELARRLAETDPARAAAEIGEVESIARDALREVRGAVSGYRLTDFRTELIQARVALQSASIQLEIDAPGFDTRSLDSRAVASSALEAQPLDAQPLDLDEASEQVLAMALREATTNVLRHSEATSCRIQLGTLGGKVTLTVQDNGKGGDVKEGHGLAGMRERATALGGRLDIRGDRGIREGSGTCVTLTLPVSPAAATSKSARVAESDPADDVCSPNPTSRDSNP